MPSSLGRISSSACCSSSRRSYRLCGLGTQYLAVLTANNRQSDIGFFHIIRMTMDTAHWLYWYGASLRGTHAYESPWMKISLPLTVYQKRPRTGLRHMSVTYVYSPLTSPLPLTHYFVFLPGMQQVHLNIATRRHQQ